LAVSAPQEDSDATGIGGNQANNSASGSGAVYLFARIGTAWSQESYIKASNTGAGDQFGHSISISSADTHLAVGALGERSTATGVGGDQADNSFPAAGAVYMFARTGSTWSQEAYIKASNTGGIDLFGHSISLSGDGTRLAVGARFESSNATGIGGNQADNSATDSGAVYVFVRGVSFWSQEAYIKASNTGADDRFGSSVSVSGDGSLLVVGVAEEDSNATGIGGNQANNSLLSAGAVYIFRE
jgi:hypothetical protein